MAWTETKVSQFNAGNEVIQLWKLVADSATEELSTGLGYLDHVTVSPASIGTANSKYAINVLTASTASYGTVSLTGCASGDVFYVTVYGR